MDFGVVSWAGKLLPTLTYTLPVVGEVDLKPYVIGLVLFLGLSVLFKLVQLVVVARLKAFSKRTRTDIDDVVIGAIAGIRPWVYMLMALYIALQPFGLPSGVARLATFIFLFAVVWQAIEIVVRFIDYAATRLLEKDEDGDGVPDPNTANASHLVALLARIVLWVLGLLFVLSNLGIEVTSLVAGLGIGGIAIAFALQGILSDLFSSFSLYFDKPFRIGDYIVIGEHSGTVERIGIKTTRLKTLQGEELVVSNAELTAARVQNFKKMKERRVTFRFGVLYETPYEKVREIPSIVARLFEVQERARLDRVHFTSFGDSALLFDVVYYVESPDYTDYLDIQQRVNLDLLDKFAEVGIEFAYPTQTVYVKQ
ncbi:mechanosensitive ion channel family protein [Candidatus Kaiserbacteria bacterium]|nr:mechanosensitive ion channel family protein [Candidatus Kaiserbacteria bacterium]